jgi:hypothetical protein
MPGSSRAARSGVMFHVLNRGVGSGAYRAAAMVGPVASEARGRVGGHSE